MKVLWLGLEQMSTVGFIETKTMNKGNYSLEEVKRFNPDIIFEREFNADGMSWEKEIKEMKAALPHVKTAVWLIDTHVRKDFHKQYAKNFDYVFMAISHLMHEIDHPNRFWLPLCHTANFVPEFKATREHELGFIGRFNAPFLENRTEFIKKVKEMYPDFYAVTDYNNLYENMSKIKIMVNLSYNQDMNFRTFEALACGNILVTSTVPDLFKISGLRERIFVFNDYDELKEIVDSLKDKTPINYQKWILDHHTPEHRLISAVKMIITNQQEDF